MLISKFFNKDKSSGGGDVKLWTCPWNIPRMKTRGLEETSNQNDLI